MITDQGGFFILFGKVCINVMRYTLYVIRKQCYRFSPGVSVLVRQRSVSMPSLMAMFIM